MRERRATGTIPVMHSTPEPFDRCPACGWAVPGRAGADTRCPHCGLPQAGPVADELRDVTAALAAVDAERHRLWTRRGQLLTQAQQFGRSGPGARQAGPMVGPQWGPRGPQPHPEATPLAVQNVLLSLGGVLLAVAALVFTLISWGHLGIGGRATVLAALTLTAMAVPALLLRRALGATAEVVAFLGLVLLLLDAFAVRRTLLPSPGALSYAAGSLAAVSAVWAGYATLFRPGAMSGPRAARGLLLPAPAALALAQFPLLLCAFAAQSAYGCAAALLGAAAGDAVVVAAAPRFGLRGLRLTAVVSGCATGAAGLVTAGALSATADGPGGAVRAGALLLAAGGCALTAAYRTGGPAPVPGAGRSERQGAKVAATALGAVAGLAAVAAFGGVVRVYVPNGWTVPGYLACAAVLLGALAPFRGAVRRPAVLGPAASAAAVHVLAVCWALPPLCRAMFEPLGWAGSVWTGAPAGARAALSPTMHGAHGLHGADGNGPVPAAAVVVAFAVAAVLVGVAALLTDAADRALGGALALGVLAVVGLTVAADLPYAAAVLLRVAVALLLLGGAALLRERPPAARAAFAVALVVAATATGWALAERATTLTVLAALLAGFAGAAAPRTGPRDLRAAAGAAAVACACGLAWAGPASAGWPAHHAAYVVLGVAAGAVALGLRAPGVDRSVEYAGYGAAAPAVFLAAGDAPSLSVVLGLAGVLAAAPALRADRRPGAAYAATVLMIAASWVRLGASDVHVPEAYTLPVTAAALTVGWLRRRRDPAASSWAAYGAGLAATLLPSLLAAWDDPRWPRPLLLGAGALAVTLLGARHRLRAPLLLGGAVLVLDALHELAPYVVQMLGFLPRWLPLALAGVALLAVGATYERRLRDVRRVRGLVRRMR